MSKCKKNMSRNLGGVSHTCTNSHNTNKHNYTYMDTHTHTHTHAILKLSGVCRDFAMCLHQLTQGFQKYNNHNLW